MNDNWIDFVRAAHRHDADGRVTHSVYVDDTSLLWRWNGELYVSREQAKLAVEKAVTWQAEYVAEREAMVTVMLEAERRAEAERNSRNAERRDLRRHVREFAAFAVGAALSAAFTLGVAP